MFRKLMSLLLRADLQPSIAWSEIDSMEIVARQFVELPAPGSRTRTQEQVLCTSGEMFVLFSKCHDSGGLSRIRFSRNLDGHRMKLTEWMPLPTPIYRLRLWPIDGASTMFDNTSPTWFGLWRNEPPFSPGSDICFIDSTDRQLLSDLRSKLLDGNVPDSLRVEEERQERFKSLSEKEQRAEFAAQLLQARAAAHRQIELALPNMGPVPEELKPAFEKLNTRIRDIERAASKDSVDGIGPEKSPDS
ncbi:MAG: hypothetical protein JWN70_1916 [Planctomycetaceae bacterium]|nr:hypothetical protein [Planctomycetaceae bacterium]